MAQEVRGLSELSQTVRQVGGAVQESGRTIGSLSSLPLVGGEVEEPARRIEEAAAAWWPAGRPVARACATSACCWVSPWG
ncbi:MAG: hypothetical protein H0T15_06610 [Thermoleophilaceae bacterium]|nr:hypothetical protein [Thermoleophilaceae bacterium]